MRPSIPLLLASMYADGSSLTNTVTATSILHGSGKPNLGGGIFDAGTTIRTVIRGGMGVGASGAGTLTLDQRIGGTVVTNFGAFSLRTSSCSTNIWSAEIELTCQQPGTAAQFISSIRVEGLQFLGGTNATTSPVPALLPQTGPSSNTNAIDTTVNGLLDTFATWSVATSGNILLARQCNVWLMN